jgi:3-oxoacyl-[acyl-carrier protein] reductase
VVNYRGSEADAQATVAAIEAAGGTAIAVHADVTRPDDCDRLVAVAREHFGDAIHILVNVAGGMVARKQLAEMDIDFFDGVMRLNAGSAFMMTKAAVPFMPEGASILNFASQAGRDGGGPGATAYAASKGAVMTFTRSMAKELGPRGIRVNALCAGMIATTFHDIFTKDEVRAAVAAASPLRRQGNAAEVGRTVVALVSDDTSFITGANIDINGGTFFS